MDPLIVCLIGALFAAGMVGYHFRLWRESRRTHRRHRAAYLRFY